jgi:cell division protease FtsH
MVAYYGMSPKVGNVSFYDSTGQRDMFTKPFSEQTAELIDSEVRRIIDEAVALTRSIINEERENIERLAELLLQKETIFSEDIEAVLGKSAQPAKEEAPEQDNSDNTTIVTTDNGVEVKYVVDSGDDTKKEDSNE